MVAQVEIWGEGPVKLHHTVRQYSNSFHQLELVAVVGLRHRQRKLVSSERSRLFERFLSHCDLPLYPTVM